MNTQFSFEMARIAMGACQGLPRRERGGHVMLVTTVEPGGAGMVGERLALELASGAQGDVALVGCEAKGSRRADGWSTLLASGSIDAKALFRCDGSPLYRIAGNPAEHRQVFFHPPALAAAVEALRERFRLSIVIGPALSDCAALIQQADKVILALDARGTSPRTVQRTLKRAGIAAGDIDGAILMNAKSKLPAWLGGE